MELKIASIYVYGDNALLPVDARQPSGGYVNIEPVYISQLAPNELTSSLLKVLTHGNPLQPDKTPEEWRKYKSPVLQVAGVPNWRRFAQQGVAYTIEWSDSNVIIDMSRLDERGRFEYDPAKHRILPRNTALETIVKIILEDVGTRPELKKISDQPNQHQRGRLL